MNMRVYLDEAATSEYKDLDNIIVQTMTSAMKDYWQNPSSLYATNVKDKINKCRANIAKFIGANPNEIYFTSGASESNNWAIRGWADCASMNGFRCVNIITTPIEHKSILEAVQNMALNANIHYCRVDKYGLINLESLENILKLCEYEPVLVSVGMANNEIGTIQDIKAIADLVHKYDGVLHVDATQALCHIPINVEELGIDMLSASGHKISPVLKGIGLLYKKNSISINPLIYGAQESGMRGGTENTFGIIGLSKAIDCYACRAEDSNIDALYIKSRKFIGELESDFGCKLNGRPQCRLPNNISVTFPQNITGESLLYTLDLSGISISTGSACNSTAIAPSHVLKAIGLTDEEAMRTVRFTLPDDIAYEEIDYVIDEIGKAIKIIEM